MKNKIRVFEAFAGYGSQSMALRRLGIDFEVIGISEIDKYAIQAYMAVHGDTPNYGDISKIDWSSVPDFDFLTYSFPCTDISTAGQQKGLAEGSGTRSSLLWECRKAIEAKRPKYLLMENVKNLVSKKFTPYLKEWIRFLEGQGYSNYTKVLNAKDFGVPQNRERVFMVSILGEVSFHFPKPFTLEKRLKDVLEKDVDESFYLSEKVVNTFIQRNKKNKERGNGFKFNPTMGEGIATSILTHPNDRPCDNFIKEIIIPELYNQKVSDICGTIKTTVDTSNMSFISEPFSIEPKCVGYTRNSKGKAVKRHLTDIANTIHGSTGSGGNTDCFVAEPKILLAAEKLKIIANATRKQDCDVTINPDLSLRPYVKDKSKSGISELQTDFDESIGSTLISARPNSIYGLTTNYRIRKLTPRECFRLMGVSEKDIDNIQKSGISKTQQYKMAGNSIVVDVLYQ